MTMLRLTLERQAPVAGVRAEHRRAAAPADVVASPSCCASCTARGAFAGAHRGGVVLRPLRRRAQPARSRRRWAGWSPRSASRRRRRWSTSCCGITHGLDRARVQVAPSERCSVTETRGAAADLPVRGRPDPQPTREPTRTGRPLGTGGVQECSGLELEADVKEYLEGGRNDGVVRRVGRVKLLPIVLKRGMFLPGRRDAGQRALGLAERRWCTGRLPIPRYDGARRGAATRSARSASRRTWSFDRGLPSKVDRPDAERQDRRDRDRGAAHRPRGPAAGEHLMTAPNYAEASCSRPGSPRCRQERPRPDPRRRRRSRSSSTRPR